jgi:anti-sigma B factor antagonist
MRITERQFGNAVVLDFRGALRGRVAAEAVAATVGRLCRNGVRDVVGNLGGVPAVDVAGLGALVDAHLALRHADGVFKLAGITKHLNDLMVITRLLTVFETYDSVEEAVGRMAAASAARGRPEVSVMSLRAINRFLRRA